MAESGNLWKNIPNPMRLFSSTLQFTKSNVVILDLRGEESL